MSMSVKTAPAVATLLMVLASGCAEKRVTPWTPQPLVQWHHMSPQPVLPVSDGYRILVMQPTRGLFPASVGVTRVAVEPIGGIAAITRASLLTDPRNEFLQWNRTLDDQMAVSEVFPVWKRDLGGGEAEPLQILAAFRALHARLGLIYAMNELSPSESEMFGILYYVDESQPLASLHARAVSIVEPEEERSREQVDLWKTDSHARVRAKFNDLLHACVRDLILQDEREAIESPDGWTPPGPIRPVEWPPRLFRTRR